MTESPEPFHRARRLMWWLAGLGSFAVLAKSGLMGAASFLIGALIGILSFQLTRRLVMGIGADGGIRPAPWKLLLLGLRYLLVGAILYAMMLLFGLDILASLCGLLIPFSAVLLESLYELIHGTRNSNHPPV
ncbi:MAG TPA: hypothetical protein VM120_24825 [Bryobacteraceae bacterium]|nr:hypothetical protein [Bryobacteraceae bacterium]